jgi:pSer/pThr/pTyr-binding forkhead associated (FHA) protein
LLPACYIFKSTRHIFSELEQDFNPYGGIDRNSSRIVSGSHYDIEYSANDIMTIRDLNSSNGTYVNGEGVQEKTLRVGDVNNIMGLKIIYNGRLCLLTTRIAWE